MADEITSTAAPGGNAPATPGAETAPAAPVEAAPAASFEQPAFTPHTEVKTLLEGAGAPEPVVETKPEAKPEEPVVEAKPEEQKPVEEAKAEEARPEEKPVEATPEPITYPEFKLPEGIVADPEKVSALTAILGEHRIAPEVGQKLVDLHSASLKQFADATLANQHKAFAEVREGWRKNVLADPQIGGAGHQTAIQAIARMRDAFVSDAKPTTPKYAADMAAFNDFLAVTGAGDHPAFLKFIHNVARKLDEPRLPPPDPKPTKANGVDPNLNRRQRLYDNPTSPTR